MTHHFARKMSIKSRGASGNGHEFSCFFLLNISKQGLYKGFSWGAFMDATFSWVDPGDFVWLLFRVSTSLKVTEPSMSGCFATLPDPEEHLMRKMKGQVSFFLLGREMRTNNWCI